MSVKPQLSQPLDGPHLDKLGLTEAAVSVLVESLEYLDGSLPPLLLCVALPEQF